MKVKLEGATKIQGISNKSFVYGIFKMKWSDNWGREK